MKSFNPSRTPEALLREKDCLAISLEKKRKPDGEKPTLDKEKDKKSVKKSIRVNSQPSKRKTFNWQSG